MEILVQMFKTATPAICISETENYAMAGVYQNVGLFDPDTDVNDLSVNDIEFEVVKIFEIYKNIKGVAVFVDTYDKATCIMLMELQQKCYKRGIDLRVMYTDTIGCY